MMQSSSPRSLGVRGRCRGAVQPAFGRGDDPLGALRREGAAGPGVEAGGAPSLDTQLGALWSFPVTLRPSQ
ncbi:hypothetical protein NAEX_05058 [Nannocystis exedens]|nr:hypothetical protein NAEX_05058 [Nannocystis exedens]